MCFRGTLTESPFCGSGGQISASHSKCPASVGTSPTGRGFPGATLTEPLRCSQSKQKFWEELKIHFDAAFKNQKPCFLHHENTLFKL